jgi:hypothetical protein
MYSWYGTERFMAIIDKLGKVYYFQLIKNRLVDDTGGQEKYQSIHNFYWSNLQGQSGKLIKIKSFSKTKKVKLFRVILSTNRTEYVATNDLISNPVASELLAEIRRRQCRVPTVLFLVGTRHCRLLYIIPVQPELI